MRDVAGVRSDSGTFCVEESAPAMALNARAVLSRVCLVSLFHRLVRKGGGLYSNSSRNVMASSHFDSGGGLFTSPNVAVRGHHCFM